MDVGFVIFIAIIVFSVLGRGLKRLMERAAEQTDARQGRGGAYEATPEEVRTFLRSLEAARQPQVRADAQAPAAAPHTTLGVLEAAELVVPQRAPVRQRARLPAQQVPQAPVRPVEVPREREGRPARRPAVRRVARMERAVSTRGRRPERQAAAPARAVRAQKARPAKAPAEALKAAAVTPLALRGLSLRQAVVWSEILGAPISLRRLRRRTPPRHQ
ncbi:MAG: hypothetical protein ACYS8L_05065 [Planctomycetota bacterium]|jgi:hypothetical protein